MIITSLILAYHISGDDVYTVGETPTVAHIVYSGTQSLSIAPDGRVLRFEAVAKCTRSDSAGSAPERAHFIQDMLPDGSFQDRADDDPDFLTILNQPFAIELDRATIRDLRDLHSQVPFEAASPVGGGSLNGTLRPWKAGVLHGHRVVGVRFVAIGSASGPLPQHALAAIINGHIRLDGTAYYDTDRALLLALDARLTIEGTLASGGVQPVPVRIVYRRRIRI